MHILTLPADVEPDDLFNALSPASQERVGALLSHYWREAGTQSDTPATGLDDLTATELEAYEEIDGRRSYREKQERDARAKTEREEKRQARIVAGAGPEPKRYSREWYQWLEGNEVATEEPPPPVREATPEPEPEPDELEQAPSQGALSLLMVEPDRAKPCWVLRSLGTTRPASTKIDGELQPMRGQKLILEKMEWRAGAWRKTGERVFPTTLNKAFAMADWVGKLPQQGRKCRTYNQENYDLAAPMLEEGMSVREIARRIGISRRIIDRFVELRENAAQ